MKLRKMEFYYFIKNYYIFHDYTHYGFRWYPLLCKPGQNKSDYRGELEVRLEFKVNASEAVGGSVADLRSKKKGSLTSLSKLKGNVGGSLMNIGTKNSGGIKKFADSGEKLL